MVILNLYQDREPNELARASNELSRAEPAIWLVKKTSQNESSTTIVQAPSLARRHIQMVGHTLNEYEGDLEREGGTHYYKKVLTVTFKKVLGAGRKNNRH